MDTLKPGDVIPLNGIPVTVSIVNGDWVAVNWFEGDIRMQSMITRTVAESGLVAMSEARELNQRIQGLICRASHAWSSSKVSHAYEALNEAMDLIRRLETVVAAPNPN
jgi:hypothetical protein